MVWSWRTLKKLPSEDLTADKFWSAVSVWNARPYLLIKQLISTKHILTESLADSSSDVFKSLADLSFGWFVRPADTFERVGLSKGDNVQIEVWKLLTKTIISEDYLRLSIFGK